MKILIGMLNEAEQQLIGKNNIKNFNKVNSKQQFPQKIGKQKNDTHGHKWLLGKKIWKSSMERVH